MRRLFFRLFSKRERADWKFPFQQKTEDKLCQTECKFCETKVSYLRAV
jgi:hypothetical protein